MRGGAELSGGARAWHPAWGLGQQERGKALRCLGRCRAPARQSRRQALGGSTEGVCRGSVCARCGEA